MIMFRVRNNVNINAYEKLIKGQLFLVDKEEDLPYYRKVVFEKEWEQININKYARVLD